MSLKDYNSQLEPITLKEYGRNVQKITEKIIEESDADKRAQMSHALVNLMKQIAPSQKDNQETVQKLWNHLHIIADFKLNLENPPFEIPSPNLFTTEPKKVPYSDNRVKMRHYGKNIDLLVQQAILKEEEEEREQAIIYLGRLMKRFHIAWNQNSAIEDEVIIQQIKQLSKGELVIDVNKVKSQNLFYVKPSSNYNQNQGSSQNSSYSSSNNRRSGGSNPRSNSKSGSSFRSSERGKFDKRRRSNR